jgi:hypothetical protein
MANLTSEQFKKATIIAAEADVPLCTWGSTGVGKSAITEEATRILHENIMRGESLIYHKDKGVRDAVADGTFGYEYHDLRLATMNDGDWGIPRVYAEVQDELTGKEFRVPEIGFNPERHRLIRSVHIPTAPYWLGREDKPGMYIINLEELNRATQMSANGAMQVLAERRLNMYKLPRLTRLFSLNNPATGGFKTKDLDAATKARFCHVYMDPGKKEWMVARQHVIDPINAERLHSCEDANWHAPVQLGDWKIQSQVMINPRTNELHARLAMYILDMDELNGGQGSWGMRSENHSVLYPMMEGMIPSGQVAKWWEIYRQGDMVSMERILNGSTNYQKIAAGGRDRMSYAVWLMGQSVRDSVLVDPKTSKMEKARLAALVAFVDALCDKKAGRAELAANFSKNLANVPAAQRKNIDAGLAQSENYRTFAARLQKDQAAGGAA